MLVRQIFSPRLAQYAYLVGCQRTGEALLIDPMRDVDRYLELAEREGLRITALAETHIHADFLSGVRELAHRLPKAGVFLSAAGGPSWRYEWAEELGDRVALLRDRDVFHVGGIQIDAIHTPGHTPEHMSFVVTDRGGGATEPMAVATGDFVFVGDLGRPDLLETAAGQEGVMEPAARNLFASARSFLRRPDYLQIWPGHGAGSACGKALGAVPQSTLGYERRFNEALQVAQETENRFVEFILEGQPEPPPYFARMKELNRKGVPLLEHLPEPDELDADGLSAFADRGDAVVLDLRRDRLAFLAAHLRGSIHAPFDKSFPTIVGSYVTPELEIALIAERDDVEEAVRELVRIGLDRVVAWAAPETLTAVGDLTETESLQAEALDPDRLRGMTVVDVRSLGEHESGHLDGALHIAHTRLLPRLADVPEDGEVAVHCASGIRAAAAASFLERHGRRVVHLNGDVVGAMRGR